MSEYMEFVEERKKIDLLVHKGYSINKVIENLNGAYVEFVKPNREDCTLLHISTANGRKYFSSLLINQNNESFNKEEE